jgi:hypothetical protein
MVPNSLLSQWGWEGVREEASSEDGRLGNEERGEGLLYWLLS